MVLARVITLRFDPTIGSFDDMPLREFLKDKEALSIREHFFAADDIPYLAVFITYRLSQVKRPVAAAEATPKGAVVITAHRKIPPQSPLYLCQSH